MTPSSAGPDDAVLWEPAPDAGVRTTMGRYLRWVNERLGVPVDDFWSLWRWSVADLDGFWRSIATYFEIDLGDAAGPALLDRGMPGSTWFPGARINDAEHVLRAAGVGPAVVSVSQTRPTTSMGIDALRDAVARCRAGLVRLGVGRGDRVTAYLPNVGETVVAFLASASLGAIWSSCAPEFGVRSVVDRFRQIEPKVLLAVDGYRYGTREVDRTSQVNELLRALPTVEHLVVLPYLHGEAPVLDPVGTAVLSWDELLRDPAPLEFERVPFDHPLYVLFSSGTTGLPKPIVHGHGGILLEHTKLLGLHSDVRPGDSMFWFSTTSWMMWNLLVSAVGLGSSIVLFDGDLAWPDLATLWRLVEQHDLTHFGVAAGFLHSCHKADLDLGGLDLSSLRFVGSTGSPLAPATARWLYGWMPPSIQLSSGSGGTDVCSALVTSSPLLPVRAASISGPGLGVGVEAYDEAGRSVVGQQGELVVTRPMPSMPVGFWGDDSGERFAAAYFEDYPGIWRHGDWVTINSEGGFVVSGRSDATLNRGGVRLGTGEYYALLESLPEVADSLVVHVSEPDGPGWLWLFVVPTDGAEGVEDGALAAALRGTIKDDLSPRHVPDHIAYVAAIPRTISGKKLEVPVKRLLLGEDPADLVSTGALVDPAAWDRFCQEAPSYRRQMETERTGHS